MTERPPPNAKTNGPYLPRKMKLESLIRTLVEEHAAMKEGISKAREAIAKRDFEALARTLR